MDISKLIPLLPDMAAFVAVVETGSFTNAAEKMDITPSAVSRQVARLEASLAAQLIERTTRRQSTTAVGMAVYEQCRNMLDNASEALRVSESDTSIPRGRLKIAIPKALAKQVLEPHLLAFGKTYPEISLHLMVTDQRMDPARQDVDIVFHVSAEPLEHLVSKRLGSVRSILCASPDYLDRRGRPSMPADLLNHDCIPLGLNQGDNHWKLTRATQQVTLAVTGRYTNNHSEMRLRAVKEGFGIGIFPDFVVHEALAEGLVEQVLPGWHVHSDFQGEVHMQFQPMRFMPAKMRAFIDFMECLGDLTALIDQPWP
ncbi:LysR family transcriptional regulator [Marinobacterium stanieri]|uniref:LysR family transcriptional regulator n=1 Tax=Marinobacterium stanieri TaxID=49186 RepID=UPI0002559C0C|nr:LysR family transcriptional regulator [Marinobacterium stanieri]